LKPFFLCLQCTQYANSIAPHPSNTTLQHALRKKERERRVGGREGGRKEGRKEGKKERRKEGKLRKKTLTRDLLKRSLNRQFRKAIWEQEGVIWGQEGEHELEGHGGCI
jgi:hypothetical protein